MMGTKLSYLPLILVLQICLTSVPSAMAGGLVVYWGQNEDGTLTSTCESGLFEVVNIAFLSQFGSGQLAQINLAGHCDPTINGCQELSNEIKACQSRSVKVMLSIGGARGSHSLSSVEDAGSVADYIWNNFLGGQSDSRPLGDAVLDGVDFDIENDGDYYDDLARRLSEHSQEGQKVYLSAAPQCPFSDNNILKKALSTGVFDYVWVQFYNNHQCEFNSADPSSFQNSWNSWTSYFNGKVYVGVPASSQAATSGFVQPQDLIDKVLRFVKESGDKYGGVMLWDRFNDLSTQYSSAIKGSV